MRIESEIYRTYDISEMLNVDDHTVKSWIKTGKMSATSTVCWNNIKRTSYWVNDENLKEFLNKHPKYKKRYRDYCIGLGMKREYVALFYEDYAI